jgi:hypothetical protein
MVYRCVDPEPHMPMQPGYRTLARSRPQNALETLFADEEARAVSPKEPPAPSRLPTAELDLELFAEENHAQRKTVTRSARPARVGSSPHIVVALVTLFSIASPLLLSQRREPEEPGPPTVNAHHASDVVLPAVDVPVATTSEPIATPPPPPPAKPTPPRAPAAATRTRPIVTPPPPRRAIIPPPASRPAVPPARPAVIPGVQLASRTSDALGALPESDVSAPAPPTPSVVHARSTEPVAAAEPVDQRAGVMATLRRYEAAYTALDARAVRTIWPGVNQGALSRAFDSLARQTIRLGNCNVTVRAPTARAVCAGTATWVPRIGGGREHQDRRTWTFSLAQRDQSWAIVSAEMR